LKFDDKVVVGKGIDTENKDDVSTKNNYNVIHKDNIKHKKKRKKNKKFFKIKEKNFNEIKLCKRPKLKIIYHNTVPFKPAIEHLKLTEELNTINDNLDDDKCALLTLLPYLNTSEKEDGVILQQLYDMLLKTDTGWAERCKKQGYVTPDLYELMEAHRCFGHSPNLLFRTIKGNSILDNEDYYTLLIYNEHVELWCGQGLFDSPIDDYDFKHYISNIDKYVNKGSLKPGIDYSLRQHRLGRYVDDGGGGQIIREELIEKKSKENYTNKLIQGVIQNTFDMATDFLGKNCDKRD